MRRGAGLLGWALAGLTAAGCGDEARHPEADPGSRPRNVLLISIDSLRADHVGAYGHRAPFAPGEAVTPTLDALAASGLRYESAWSSTSWTLPAHVALLTGLDDPAHGVVDQGFAIDPAHSTLATHLTAAGYRCRGVYSGPFLHERWGFDRGFESWRSAMISPTEVTAEIEQWARDRVARGLPEPSAEEREQLRRYAPNWSTTGRRVNEHALRDLEELAAGDRPWFLFVHYYDPHYDYVPERADPALADKFDPGYTGRYSGVDWYGSPAVRAPEPPFERRIPPRDLAHVEALYDGEIHFVDRQIGSLLTRLRRLGLEEQTVVAVVSDHGDEFFDRGGIGHRHHLHVELTRAVFLLRAPGRVLPGSVYRPATSFVDVTPTLLHVAGAPPMTQAFGAVRLPDRPAPTTGAFGHLFVTLPRLGDRYAEVWRDDRFTVMRLFVRADPDGACQELRQPLWPDDSPAYYVYDRDVDPDELQPIPPDHPAYQRAVEAMRVDFLRRAAQRRDRNLSPVAQRVVGPAESRMDAQLEALGYAEGETGAAAAATPLPLCPLPVPETAW